MILLPRLQVVLQIIDNLLTALNFEHCDLVRLVLDFFRCVLSFFQSVKPRVHSLDHFLFLREVPRLVLALVRRHLIAFHRIKHRVLIEQLYFQVCPHFVFDFGFWDSQYLRLEPFDFCIREKVEELGDVDE